MDWSSQFHRIFLVGEDPQGLATEGTSWTIYFWEMVLLPFIAVGEEFLKAIVGLALLSLTDGLRWNIRLPLAAIVSALVFGYLHVINYPVAVGLPIALGSIPYPFFMVYYRSILPLILAHFIWDGFVFTFEQMPSVRIIVAAVYLVYLVREVVMNRRQGRQAP